MLKKMLCGFIVTFALAGCGGDEGQIEIPSQHWKDMDVRIETHPNPPLAGMSEIVVIVTGPRGRPIQDLTVSLRGNEAMPWVQGIQDGLIGVYRRAVDLGTGDSVLLQVELQQGGEQKILSFPLNLAAG
jgi:hypothetical protein